MYDQTYDRRTTIRLAGFAAAVLAAIALAFGMVSCQHDGTPTASGPDPQLPAATRLEPEATPSPTPTEDAEPTDAGQGEDDGDDDAGQGGGGGDNGGTDDGQDDGDGPDDDGEDDGADILDAAMANKDCVSYDPENLSLAESGVEWILESGAKKLISFDSEAKANKAVKAARKFSTLCFIGRSNDMDNRYQYMTTYWEDPSGLPLGPVRLNDCDPYDPASIELEDMGPMGWRLQTSGTPLGLSFASVADALRGREVAMQHTTLCFLDRDNEPGSYRNTHEYWQG